MLANFLLFAGISGSIISLGEIFLTAAQKEKLYNQLLAFWICVDNLSKVSYISALAKGRRLIKAVLLVAILFLCLSATAFDRQMVDVFSLRYPPELMLFLRLSGLAFALVMFSIGVPLSYYPLRRLVKTGDNKRIFRQIVIVLSFYLFISLINVIYGRRIAEAILGATSYVLIISVLCILEGVATQLVLYYVVILALPLFTLYVLSFVLKTLELVIRRIAEFPKGVAFVLSTIITACAAFLKVFAPT